MGNVIRWALALVVVGIVGGIPATYFRAHYAYAKRLRVVSDGKFYRCGQLTAPGFRDAIRRFGIRTVINLQQENQDPFVREGYFDKASVHESDVCKELDVRYVVLGFDDGLGLIPRGDALTGKRPAVIDDYLDLLDDPTAYPLLLHCKAGLHRTGLLTAIYRIEYEGRSTAEAVRELRANGFGNAACTTADDYVFEYMQQYRPGQRRATRVR